LNPELLPSININNINNATAKSLNQPIKLRALDLIPDIEWWDSYYLPQGKKSFIPYLQKQDNANINSTNNADNTTNETKSKATIETNTNNTTTIEEKATIETNETNEIKPNNINEVKIINFDDFILNDNDFEKDKITIYIQHPPPIKNDYIEKSQKVAIPMFLTDKEKKKLRKLRRSEKEKDKQERMKLGLLKPPPPKLKFNNFMRILGDEAIQDPSKV